MKELPDFEAGGRHPCLFSYVRHVAHSNRLPRPTWCHSLEPGQGKHTHVKGHPRLRLASNICPREAVCAYLLRHSGCSSWNPARCHRCRGHPRWRSLRLLLTGRVELWRRLSIASTIGENGGGGLCADCRAHLNNCATMRWCWPLPSGSLLCGRKAVGVADGRLWFLQPREFFSSDSRS